MANRNVDRPATSIPCDNFNSDVDHLPDYIPIFENACIVATNPSDAKKESTFLQWFPIKLDKRARDLFKSIVQTNKSWATIWGELKELLIDPQERYNWKAKKSTITWDGKETFHALETRIKRAVDLFEDPAVVKSEYFFRFRAALPKEYRKAIDLGCEEDARTIENAKKCALRLQLALADDDDDATSSKNVAFSGAAMVDTTGSDRVKALGMSFQDLSLQMGDRRDSLKKVADQNRPGYDRSARREPDRRDDARSSRHRDYSRERYFSHYHSRDHGRRDDYNSRRREDLREDRRDDYDSRCREDQREGRRDDYDSRRREDHREDHRDDHRDERHRYRRDNRDRRDSRDHRDSYHREGRGDRDCDEHDHRDDRWDRRDNEDRDYRSRDRSPDRSSDDDYD